MSTSEFDAILERARMLPAADRARLAEQLLDEARVETERDEIDTGRRGLAALTESTRNEDWSDVYPATLRKRKAG